MFVSGISRFVLIRAGLGFLVLGTLFDRFWNSINTQVEKKSPYSLALVSQESSLLDQVKKNFELYDIYSLNTSVEEAEIVMSVGERSKEELQ